MRLRLKSPAFRVFTQTFVHEQIKENTKALRHWPLWEESTGDRWFASQRASNAKNVSIWWHILSEPFLFTVLSDTKYVIDGWIQKKRNSIAYALGPLLLTWFNFNPSMDK